MAKNLPVNAGGIRDTGLIPGTGRYHGRGHGNPLQCSCLENPMDTRAWRATALGVERSQIRLKRLSTTLVNFSFLGIHFEETIL